MLTPGFTESLPTSPNTLHLTCPVEPALYVVSSVGLVIAILPLIEKLGDIEVTFVSSVVPSTLTSFSLAFIFMTVFAWGTTHALGLSAADHVACSYQFDTPSSLEEYNLTL